MLGPGAAKGKGAVKAIGGGKAPLPDLVALAPRPPAVAKVDTKRKATPKEVAAKPDGKAKFGAKAEAVGDVGVVRVLPVACGLIGGGPVSSFDMFSLFFSHFLVLYAICSSHIRQGLLCSFCANIVRCLWCFTLLMNLHDIVTEPFNPEHIFRDARTVPFCLTTDHISTLQDSTVWVCSGHVANGSVVSVHISDVCISGTEYSQHPWSPMEKWCGDLSATMEYDGELGAETCQHSWSTMQSLVWKLVSIPCRW